MTSLKFVRLSGLKWLAGICVLASQAGLIATVRAEDRTLSFYHIHTEERLTVTFKKNGKFVPEALQQINHIMRDWRKNAETKMDPEVIDLVWQLHEELGSKEPVHVICGYRSPATNEFLRRTQGGQAKNSRHITGQAVDMMFPDVPLKQLRYSALIRERGGVGFYPASGVPFVHVDTGNVRHWPRLPRLELAMLFPNGRSSHVPEDGRPITVSDAKSAQSRWRTAGLDMPWVLTGKPMRPILASLTSAGPEAEARTNFSAKPGARSPSAARPDAAGDTALAPPAGPFVEEGDEQEDTGVFEPLPATFLLADKPLSYSDSAGDADVPRRPFSKMQILLAPANVLTSEDFDRRLQIEDLYEANIFKGPAITALAWRRVRQLDASAATGQVTR